jgi:DNA modification methylase
MSGIGRTGIVAMDLGRNYVGIELEHRFVALQRENLNLVLQQGVTG